MQSHVLRMQRTAVQKILRSEQAYRAPYPLSDPLLHAERNVRARSMDHAQVIVDDGR